MQILTGLTNLWVQALLFLWTPVQLLIQPIVADWARTRRRLWLRYLYGSALMLLGIAAAHWEYLGSWAWWVGAILVAAGGFLRLQQAINAGAIGAGGVIWMMVGAGLAIIPAQAGRDVLRQLAANLGIAPPPPPPPTELEYRAIRSAKNAALSFLVLPGLELSVITWLIMKPDYAIFGITLLVCVLGLAIILLAVSRGRDLGTGIDIIMGVNIFLLFGAVIDLLVRASYPQFYSALSSESASFDGRMATYYTDRLVSGQLLQSSYNWTWNDYQMTALIVLFVLALVALLGTVLWWVIRMVRRTPEREIREAAGGDGTLRVVGTPRRGWSFSGSWAPLLSAGALFGLLAVIYHLVWAELPCWLQNSTYVFATGGVVMIGLVLWGFTQLFDSIKGAGWFPVVACLMLACALGWRMYDQASGTCPPPRDRSADTTPTPTPPPVRVVTPPQPTKVTPTPAPRRPRRARYVVQLDSALCPRAARRTNWQTPTHADVACRSEQLRARRTNWRRRYGYERGSPTH